VNVRVQILERYRHPPQERHKPQDDRHDRGRENGGLMRLKRVLAVHLHPIERQIAAVGKLPRS